MQHDVGPSRPDLFQHLGTPLETLVDVAGDDCAPLMPFVARTTIESHREIIARVKESTVPLVSRLRHQIDPGQVVAVNLNAVFLRARFVERRFAPVHALQDGTV